MLLDLSKNYLVRTDDHKYVKRKEPYGIEVTCEPQASMQAVDALQLATDCAKHGLPMIRIESEKTMVEINMREIKCPCGAVWKRGRFALHETTCPHCAPSDWQLSLSLVDCKPIRIE